jgi:hypothetical protein
MAGDWFPLLFSLGVLLIAGGAAMTIRHGVISYLFLDFRRAERPMEFWIALLLITAGAIGVLYVLLV